MASVILGPGLSLSMPLLDASVTNSLVTLATHIVSHLGLIGVALLTLSSGVIGVPGTEATMLFAGFDVYQGHNTLLGIIVAGVIGDLIGASIAYWIGRRGLHELLDRRGSPLHVSERKLALAERWFDRFGAPVIFVSRLIPLLRAVFPYAAGTAEMPFGRFFAFTAAGSVVWIGGLGIVGRAVGHAWPTWRHNLEYVDYAIVVLFVVAVVGLVLRRRRRARAATV